MLKIYITKNATAPNISQSLSNEAYLLFKIMIQISLLFP